MEDVAVSPHLAPHGRTEHDDPQTLYGFDNAANESVEYDRVR
jgi:hypothetical protein